jgi:hypothetical protein
MATKFERELLDQRRAAEQADTQTAELTRQVQQCMQVR